MLRGFLGYLALAVCLPYPALAVSPVRDTRFKVVYTDEWKWRQAQRLEEDEDQVGGRKEISPQLPKVDAATQQARLAHWQRVMRQLSAIEPGSLRPEDRTNLTIYREQITVLINRQKFHEYEKPLNADTAFWSILTVTALKRFHTVRDYTNYLAQLNDMPRYFEEQIVNMRVGLKRGFTPPQVTLLGRDASLTAVTQAKRPEDVVFYTPFRTMPDSVRQANRPACGHKAWRPSGSPSSQLTQNC